MNLAITFRRTADNEFIETSTWYEEKRTGLSAEFIAEIERCLILLQTIQHA